ncbi:hypothetical protein FHS96_000386 [Sphingomonas zeicaulis]
MMQGITHPANPGAAGGKAEALSHWSAPNDVALRVVRDCGTAVQVTPDA